MKNLEIEEKVKEAIKVLYKKDKSLIKEKSHEQSICAQLMCYLKPLFIDFDVDIEYNRKGEKKRVSKVNSKNDKRRPDIIIHKRGDDKKNILIIEAKGYWNIANRNEDKKTLKDLKKKYNYQIAFFLEFDKNDGILEEIK